MSILITGGTGYIGSYVVAEILKKHSDNLSLLVRAQSRDEAERRLWKALQLHMGFDEFAESLSSRIDIVIGDLGSRLGLDETAYDRLVEATDSIIHIAASLNRRSAWQCFNVNLRGSLEVIKLARAAHAQHGLRRFSDVSTCAVAGKRKSVLVSEEDMVDWSLRDYDSYARTKKFAEHMARELLPDVSTVTFRPSTVMGDTRFAETTQFDMTRAFAFLAELKILPLARDWRIDIVPTDFVGRTIVSIHQKDKLDHNAYNISSGRASKSYGDILGAMAAAGHPNRPRFVPALYRASEKLAGGLAVSPRRWGVSRSAGMLRVFLPYLASDTVFDNAHIVGELGEEPAPFTDYAYRLYRFASESGFQYPYRPWPA